MTRIEDRHEGFSHCAGRSPPALFSLGIPAAIVIMAQLRALQSQNRSRRMAPIVALVRLLYGYGYDHGQVRSLLRLIGQNRRRITRCGIPASMKVPPSSTKPWRA